MPKTPLLAKQKIKKKMTHLEELNAHTFTVKWVKIIFATSFIVLY